MKNFKLIDNYFRGDLNVKQRSDFDVRIKKDTAFANEVNSYKASQNLIEAIIQDNLRKSLNKLESSHADNLSYRIANHSSDNVVQFETENSTQTGVDFIPEGRPQSKNHAITSKVDRPSKIGSTFSGIRQMAASVLLVLCVGGFWWFNATKSEFSHITTDHLLFTEYNQVRSADEYQITIAQIAALEKTKDFKGANALIAEKMSAHPEIYSNLQYFYAQNLFRMKKFDQATAIFDQIIASDNRRFTEAAQLMKVFIDVEQKQYNKALSTIASLEADPNFSMKTKLAQIKLAIERQ